MYNEGYLRTHSMTIKSSVPLYNNKKILFPRNKSLNKLCKHSICEITHLMTVQPIQRILLAVCHEYLQE